MFGKGLITKKNYWVTVYNTRIRVSDLSDFIEFDSAILEYVVELNNQADYNIASDALGKHNWFDLKWEIYPEPSTDYSFSIMRNSIFQLWNDEKLNFLRNIVIGDSKRQQDAKFNRNKFLEKHSLDKLNEEQENAVIGCMSANNFHIIEGGAKTGKTTMVVALLEVLRRTKKKILVVSSTNDKLDNLLVKASQKMSPLFE